MVKKHWDKKVFVHGFVKDENGKPLKDVLIEVWQANAGGNIDIKMILAILS